MARSMALVVTVPAAVMVPLGAPKVFSHSLIGLAALGAAVWVLTVAQTQLSETSRLLFGVALAGASLILATLPWILRVRRALAQARQDAAPRPGCRRMTSQPITALIRPISSPATRSLTWCMPR